MCVTYYVRVWTAATKYIVVVAAKRQLCIDLWWSKCRLCIGLVVAEKDKVHNILFFWIPIPMPI